MPHLSIALLGPLQITLDGAPVTAFESDKVRALLIFLAVEADRPHRRGALAGLLWPERPERAALLNLNQALANLRRAIGDRDASTPALLASRESIQLNPTAGVAVDLAEFAELLATCERHAHTSPTTCAQCARRRERALALYRGAFLEQFAPRDSVAFQEWALVLRERFQRQAVQALAALAAYYERRGEVEAALRAAHRQAELDPWSEEAHRQVMRLLALDGQRAAALAQYEKCRALLDAEFGVEPEEETIALYERILTGKLSAEREESQKEPPESAQFSIQATPFVGRQEELQQLAVYLNDPARRLITLAGLGGSGKTRLALQAALEQRDAFADGVCFVPLAPVETDALIAPAVASALGLALSGADDPLAQVVAHLRDRQRLLVLDNLEHLAGAGRVVTAIRDGAPGVTILATSRERLQVHGEWVLNVDGLDTPDGAAVETSGAGALFLQAARRVSAAFAPEQAERLAIVAICRALSGHPLAVELAAAWVHFLTPREIEAEIAGGLDLLATAEQNVPERHRSLRAVLDGSWRLLPEEQRQVVRRLAVFRAGFDREAAEAVAVGASGLGAETREDGELAGRRPQAASLTILAALAGKALLRRSSAGRYDLHPLVRQYALAQLEAAGEAGQTRSRMIAWAVALVERAEPHFKGADEEIWLERLAADHDNLRTALGHALDAGQVEIAGRLCAVLRWFWYIRGHIGEGRQWIERVLAEVRARSAALPARLQARLLQGAGVLSSDQGDYARGTAYFEQALALYRELPDDAGIQACVHSLGMLASEQGDYARAQAYFEQSLEACRKLGQTWGVANRLNSLGIVAFAQGQSARALEYYEEALATARALDNEALTAMVLSNIGDAALALGDLPRAQAVYAEALRRQRAIEDLRSAALSLHGLGIVALRQGDLALAERQLYEGLAISWSTANRRDLAASLEGVAALLAARGAAAEAARLCAALETFREQHGTPISAAERPQHEAAVASAREQLGPAFDSAWAAGRVTPLERLIGDVLKTTSAPS